MKQQAFLLIISAVLLVSCHREQDWDGAPDIRAEVESEQNTRTSISVDESGAGTIYWNPSDKIDVFFGTKKAQYTSQNASDAISAYFKTSDSVSGTDESLTNIWGLYPSNSSSSCNGSSITTTLPSTQYGVPNTFDKDIFLGVAHSSSLNLPFYNVCGGIKFNLAYDDIKKITFRGNNNEDLAGTVSISFVDNIPKATIVNGVKEITLTPKTGTTFTKGADYYFVLLPGTLSAGFTITFTATDGTTGTLNYTDNPVTIKRSIFGKKGNMDVYAAFADGRQPNNVIYYTSSDGKVVAPYKTDVFGAKIVSNESVGGRGIIAFDKDVMGIGMEAFYLCTSLTSISLPNTVTTISLGAFQGSSLISIEIPNSVTYIGQGAFHHCASLTSIFLPASVASFGYGNPFGQCPGLTSITVSSDNPVFDSRDNCNAIIFTQSNELISGCKNTVIPNTVQSIGISAFAYCTGLTKITIPNSITRIGSSAFAGCTGLTSVEIPNSVTRIDSEAFHYSSGLNSITVYASLPPEIGTNALRYTNNCPIYVPAESVNAYKTAEGWSEYADRIYAMGASYEAVDLGLPSGVRWATCNVGASSPEEYGDYFAWGETEPKSNYDWSTYKWCNGSDNTLTKYCSNSSYGNNGFTDNKTVLDLEDDAARANWGGSWRMPTDAEWTELRTQCVWTWTTLGGKNGYNVRGPNGNTIFLPAAGCRNGTSLHNAGSYGYYWSSSLYTGNPNNALSVDFFSSNVRRSSNYHRSDGPSVRPVYGDFISVESISLNKSSLSIIEGETSQLSATVMPANATEKTVTWTSSNTSVAIVSSAGVVTAVSAGAATITAWASDGSHSATCTVTVSQRVTDITISPDNATIYTGEQVALRAIVSPSSATNPGVSWSSSDSSIAFVSSDGTVLGVMAGTATITAQANDGSGITGTCVVTVKQHVTGVSIDSQSQVVMGGTRQLYVTISPSNASDRSVTWSSSDTSVAVVDANGMVSGIVNGTAIITATSVDGDYMASCELTVTLPTTPSHLSLVVSRSGDASSRYYLTKEQYNVANLSGYYKQGVCVHSSSFFIVNRQDLYTSATGSTANGAAIMPNEEQANWLISNMQTLNSALTSFGCTAMSTTANYWSSKKRGDRYYYYFKYNGSMVFDNSGSATARARPLVSL